MSDIVVEPSSVEEMALRAEKLFAAHAEECEPHFASSLDPDWDAYHAAEQEGRLIAFAAKADDEIVGYIAGATLNNVHYRSIVDFQIDVFFVEPSHRRHRLGMRLLNKIVAAAAAAGGDWFRIHAKPGSPLEAMLHRLDFTLDEVLFTKDLRAWQG